MPQETIKQVLMRRDGMTSEEADDAITNAVETLRGYIEEDDMDGGMNVCQEEFGLEPDYIDELMDMV